jgi:hypothetical protein
MPIFSNIRVSSTGLRTEAMTSRCFFSSAIGFKVNS